MEYSNIITITIKIKMKNKNENNSKNDTIFFIMEKLKRYNIRSFFKTTYIK